MSYQALARKWRPRTFAELVGQTHVVRALVNGLEQERLHHAFLFTGTRGVGKTTIARILAKCLNCEQGISATPCGECGACTDIDSGRFVDMLEIDAASKTKVDDTREMLDNVQYMPTRGRFKVYIIDEVHMLSTHSFNALLKTLEEPPPHVKFVLATTDPQKIPVTILSRCLRFNLKHLLADEIAAYLADLLQREQIEYDPESIQAIALAADGSMRDSLSLLDQAIAFGGGKLVLADIQQMLGSIDDQHIVHLLELLHDNDVQGVLQLTAEFAEHSRDFDRLLSQLAEALHRITILQQAPEFEDLSRSGWDHLKMFAQKLSAEDAQLFYQFCLNGRRELELAPDARVGAEMVLMRMLAFRPQLIAQEPEVPPVSSGGQDSSPEVNESVEQQTAAPQPDKPAQLFAQAELPWAELIETLGLSGAVKELSRNLTLQSSLTADNLEFSISEELAHIATEKARSALTKILSAHFSRPLSIQIKAVGGTLDTPAMQKRKYEAQRMSEAERAIENDPTVTSLKEQLGAEVVSGSVQPIQ